MIHRTIKFDIELTGTGQRLLNRGKRISIGKNRIYVMSLLSNRRCQMLSMCPGKLLRDYRMSRKLSSIFPAKLGSIPQHQTTIKFPCVLDVFLGLRKYDRNSKNIFRFAYEVKRIFSLEDWRNGVVRIILKVRGILLLLESRVKYSPTWSVRFRIVTETL